MEEFVYYNELFSIYGELFNSKDSNIFELYYMENLTMQEIADSIGITKSRVGVVLKNIENKLSLYEKKLKLYEKKLKIEKIFDENDINILKNKLKIILDE